MNGPQYTEGFSTGTKDIVNHGITYAKKFGDATLDFAMDWFGVGYRTAVNMAEESKAH